MSSSRKIQRIFVLFLSLLYLIVYHFNLVFNQTESLVVGGHFSTITHLYNLLSWNDGDWAEIGDGLQSANNYNEVLCLDESRYGLVIGGDFSLAGLQNAALYNGSSFVQWGRIGGDAVIAVTVDNESDTIFIAKQMAGGRIPTSISMWRFDDSRWREVPGALLTGKDAALYVYQKRLYVSGIVLFQNNNSTARCTKTSVFRHSTQTWRCIDYEANGFFTWNNTLVAFGNPRTGPPIVTIEEDIFKPLGGNLSIINSEVTSLTSDGERLFAAAGPLVFVLDKQTLHWQLVEGDSPNFVDTITWIGFWKGTLYAYSNQRMSFWNGTSWVDMSHMFWGLTGKINALLVTSKNYGSITFRIPTGGIIALVVGACAIFFAAFVTFYCLRKRQDPFKQIR